MKSQIFVLVLSLAVASVMAKTAKGKGKEGKEEGKGLYLTEENMMNTCKAGTSWGEKTMAVMETWSDNAVAEARVKKEMKKGKKPKPNKVKGKGKDKSPSVDRLEKMAINEYVSNNK